MIILNYLLIFLNYNLFSLRFFYKKIIFFLKKVKFISETFADMFAQNHLLHLKTFHLILGFHF